MLGVRPAKESGQPLSILCLGCHSDDIEIGCGGTLLRLTKEQDVHFHWVVFTGDGVRQDEARRAADLFTAGGQLASISLHDFRDGFLPYTGAEVKNVFEELKESIAPDIVFTHYGRDAHQDHRLVSELTWNTFRDHMIFEYEIPKWDGDLGRPNFFVPLDRTLCDRKVSHLHDAFASQKAKRWFQPDTFLGLMRIRGMECNSDSGYAEAFYTRKLVWNAPCSCANGHQSHQE